MGIDLIIKNGTVVSLAGVAQTDIAIKDGKIITLGTKHAFPKAERVVDANGNESLKAKLQICWHL